MASESDHLFHPDDPGYEVTPGPGHNSATAASDYSGDVDASALDDVPTDDKIARVRDLAKLQVLREAVVTRLETELKTDKERLAEVANRDLPNLLIELNVKKYPLANGASITLQKKVVASVLEENRPAFYDWMWKKADAGPLVKRTIAVESTRGDAKKLGKLLAVINRWYKDFIVTDKESIHHSTLSAWAKELLEKNLEAMRTGVGKVLEPPEILKITELNESKIVLPKDKTVDWS